MIQKTESFKFLLFPRVRVKVNVYGCLSERAVELAAVNSNKMGEVHRIGHERLEPLRTSKLDQSNPAAASVGKLGVSQ